MMDFDKEISKKIEELQALEAHLQGFLAQRQSFQLELNEINNALSEVEKMSNSEDIYKITYGIMMKSNKGEVSQDLQEKKKISEARISSLERQQSTIEKSIDELREDITKKMSKKQKC